MDKKRSVAFHTLGCKLNFSETSTLSRLMESEGFEKKEFDDLADVYVINTCSVTDNADKECRQLVRRIQRKSPESFVVITGCYAQLKPKEIASIPGVDLVLGAAEKFNIAQHINELAKGNDAKVCSCDIEAVSGFNASFSQNDRTRTFLKVQDGCDYTCSNGKGQEPQRQYCQRGKTCYPTGSRWRQRDCTHGCEPWRFWQRPRWRQA